MRHSLVLLLAVRGFGSKDFSSLRLGVWFRKEVRFGVTKWVIFANHSVTYYRRVLQYNFSLLIKLAFWFMNDCWIDLLKILSHVEYKRMDKECYLLLPLKGS